MLSGRICRFFFKMYLLWFHDKGVLLLGGDGIELNEELIPPIPKSGEKKKQRAKVRPQRDNEFLNEHILILFHSCKPLQGHRQ